ncbi:hypothetical protein GH714_004749 [Hevea brasiliensis]|uniref:Uncharacterized protein n=1 Tax=Hevea brasiliensis TaxID=3981 RepID=A0A6A6M7K4_HEVBR|nr:hypothetical protein GH714_004749 [Hevea brasiliensis]
MQEKKSQPKKDSQRKPDGISRQVYALTGVLAPFMPSIDTTQLKRRPPSDEKITWRWLPFTNSARKDNLQLYHWVRGVNGVPPTGDYSFAKYNKSVDVVRYKDEEYEKYLTDPLVSRAILIARAPSPGDVSGHPLVKEPYNVSQREIASGHYPWFFHKQSSKSERMLRFLPFHGEESTLPVASNAGPEMVETATNVNDTVSPSSNALLASAAIASSTSVMAENASTLAFCACLLFQLQYKEAEGSSFRDGSYTEMPGTPKRSHRDQDQTFVADSMSFGGERAGRRDQKRKGPGRFSEAPLLPTHKRPRKLKASDL